MDTNVEIETAEYLRCLSQSAYNIRLIIDIHCAPLHYFDKKLDQFYTDATVAGGEKEKLINLLRRPTGVRQFPFRESVLVRNLVANDCKTKREIRYLDMAKEELLSLLIKIQDERKKSSVYEATTGPEDGPLKDYIVSLINEKKKDYSLSLLGIKESSTLKNETENILIKNKKTIDINLPERIEWDKLTIKIKEGLEKVEIFYDEKHIKTTNYIELGFCATKKNHRPNREWNLLNILSVLQRTNIREATPEKLKPMLEQYSGKKIKKDNVYQAKRLLSKSLKSIFNTKEDPFTLNKIYYEPRFIILPEPGLRTPEVWSTRLKDEESHEPSFFLDSDSENSYDLYDK